MSGGTNIRRRALLVAAAQGGVMMLLAGRLFQLQILDAHHYDSLASSNRISFRPVIPQRGMIFDGQGLPLALNRRVYQLTLIAEETSDAEASLRAVARIIPLPEQRRREVIGRMATNPAFAPIEVLVNLSWDDVARLEAHHDQLEGMRVVIAEQRLYPFGEENCHVVGYMGEADKEQEWVHERQRIQAAVGRDGMESHFDTYLRGTPGLLQLEVNAYGKPIRDLNRQAAVAGHHVHLTLDQRVQSLAARRFGDESGAAVLMDCRDGSVKAMVSRPGYDPQRLSQELDSDYWQKLTDDEKAPLVNKAIAGLYAPGSVFKLVVALAALEEGVANDFETVNCEGFIEAGGRRFHCWREEGHGELALAQAIAQSCDVYFYRLMEKVSIDAVKKMALRLGLGQSYDLPLAPQKAGFIPDSAWKQRRFGERWHQGNSYVNGIGQGWVSCNALQLAVMASALATGDAFLNPSLLQNEPRTKPHTTPIGDYILKPIQQGMVAAVNDDKGTAYAARIAIDRLEMAGKTGTSQVRQFLSHERTLGSLSNRQLPWHLRDHAVFVGYAPLRRPRYAVSVLVEHGGGGAAVAAPIARDILLWAQRWLPDRNAA